MIKKILLVSVFLMTFGCQQETVEWNPIFENTNFAYLNTSIDRSLSLIDEAATASETDQAATAEKLSQARNRLLQIKDYYLPLTTVRQKIYDAERYYKLKDIKESENLLEESKSIISSLYVTTKNDVFDQVILDLTQMIDAVMISFDEGSEQNTYNKMKALGVHVNLMLFKGDLVLSGIEFDK